HMRIDAGENTPRAVLVPPGVVHAYKNIGTTDGVVYNAPNRLFAGEGRKSPVDEIRHEDDPDSPFKVTE
ncbi:MAG: dTDP-4-dehydrorhamnose 3,5-epimerase, partial [candidate division Zixibacteria bacterium]|nr:dTDP-4-dehydrorhamnose 3,5-epimerase [candidate division Zixibacteria bacterium]